MFSTIRFFVRAYFYIALLFILGFLTNRCPTDGSGSNRPWINWLPWGHNRKRN